jgi:hypothetical protein
VERSIAPDPAHARFRDVRICAPNKIMGMQLSGLVSALLRRCGISTRLMTVMGQRTNPLCGRGLAARSGDYVCRSNYLNERK